MSALAIVQILFISRRRGGLVPLLWTGLLLAVLIHGLGPWWIADPWEPRGLTLVCVALIFLAFDAALGRLAALPVAAVAATLLAQAPRWEGRLGQTRLGPIAEALREPVPA